jgi:hypothetical protein
LLHAQTELIRIHLPFNEGVGVPRLEFDEKRRTFIAEALVTNELAHGTVDEVKRVLQKEGVFTVGVMKWYFPELLDGDVDVHFSTLEGPTGRKPVAEYVHGRLSFN